MGVRRVKKALYQQCDAIVDSRVRVNVRVKVRVTRVRLRRVRVR